MPLQLMLQDQTPPARARKTDPASSKEAAKEVNVEHLQSEILRLIGSYYDYSGATCSQIALMLDMPRDSISPRMKPLEAMGKIERTGQRRKFPGSRVSQTIWRIKR